MDKVDIPFEMNDFAHYTAHVPEQNKMEQEAEV